MKKLNLSELSEKYHIKKETLMVISPVLKGEHKKIRDYYVSKLGKKVSDKGEFIRAVGCLDEFMSLDRNALLVEEIQRRPIEQLSFLFSEMQKRMIPGQFLLDDFNKMEEKFQDLLYFSDLEINIVKKYESLYERDIRSKIELSHEDLNYRVKG